MIEKFLLIYFDYCLFVPGVVSAAETVGAATVSAAETVQSGESMSL